MTEHSGWKPDMEEVIAKIIRETIASSGGVQPDELPHLIRRQLEGRVSGEVDIDDYIKQALVKIKNQS